jgi:ankyrin repeat protein
MAAEEARQHALAGRTIHPLLWPALYEAVTRVDFTEVRRLCSVNAALVDERIDWDGRTSLHVACGWEIQNVDDALRMAALLLDELHADVNAASKHGNTPAHDAAHSGAGGERDRRSFL